MTGPYAGETVAVQVAMEGPPVNLALRDAVERAAEACRRDSAAAAQRLLETQAFEDAAVVFRSAQLIAEQVAVGVDPVSGLMVHAVKDETGAVTMILPVEPAHQAYLSVIGDRS